MTLMMALFIVGAVHGTSAGCGGLYGNAAIWVREADVIVRARAVEETPLPARERGVSTQVRFEIVETLKGTAPSGPLTFPGRLTEVDDTNDSAGARKWVRKSGRAGSCYADSYKRGAEFLLMLRPGQDGALTPYWASLGATNEQLFGAGDEWLAWVRRQLATPDGAKAMFYDPLPTPHAPPAATLNAAGLRTIAFVQPFPPYGRVGIHYWFEDARGRRFSESGAAAAGGRFTLHIRNNVGAGFLTVWRIDADSGVQLTPADPVFTAPRVDDREFVVPGALELGASTTASRLIIIFSRSQTEQPSSVAHARERVDTISKWTAPGGPEVVRESEESVAAEVGTYVVNQRGRPVAADIVVQAVKRE